jgi:hypothetical protein
MATLLNLSDANVRIPFQSFNILIKGSKLQWLQGPREISGRNLINERYEASRRFRKKEGISKDKINELAKNRKNANIRDL